MKTLKMPAKRTSHLPVPVTRDEPKLFWSLFIEKNGKWTRASNNAYYNARLAFLMFTDTLKSRPLTAQIMPVKVELDKAQNSHGSRFPVVRSKEHLGTNKDVYSLKSIAPKAK